MTTTAAPGAVATLQRTPPDAPPTDEARVRADPAALLPYSAPPEVLAAVKRIVESSDAVTALTWSCCASELQHHRPSLLGTRPWLTTKCGIVSLKGHSMSSAALRIREFVVQSEAEVAPIEDKVLAGWNSRDAGTNPIGRAAAALRQ